MFPLTSAVHRPSWTVRSLLFYKTDWESSPTNQKHAFPHQLCFLSLWIVLLLLSIRAVEAYSFFCSTLEKLVQIHKYTALFYWSDCEQGWNQNISPWWPGALTYDTATYAHRSEQQVNMLCQSECFCLWRLCLILVMLPLQHFPSLLFIYEGHSLYNMSCLSCFSLRGELCPFLSFSEGQTLCRVSVCEASLLCVCFLFASSTCVFGFTHIFMLHNVSKSPWRSASMEWLILF